MLCSVNSIASLLGVMFQVQRLIPKKMTVTWFSLNSHHVKADMPGVNLTRDVIIRIKSMKYLGVTFFLLYTLLQ